MNLVLTPAKLLLFSLATNGLACSTTESITMDERCFQKPQFLITRNVCNDKEIRR